MYVLQIDACPFLLFPSAIVLSVLRYTDSDYPFGIFKFFLYYVEQYSSYSVEVNFISIGSR